MTVQERADKILSNFEQTHIGWRGNRYDDPNLVGGSRARLGTLRHLIEEHILGAESDMREQCAQIVEHNYREMPPTTLASTIRNLEIP